LRGYEDERRAGRGKMDERRGKMDEKRIKKIRR